MNIIKIKIFALVFLATFLIGYASVLLFKKVPTSIETPTFTQEKLSYSSIEQTTEPLHSKEIIDWQEDDETKFKIKLLETGEGFHGDQVKAKSGETWLGLFKEKDDYTLRSTKINIRMVEDIVDKPGQATGKAVIVKGNNPSVFLLKNAKMLKEGPIETIFHNPSDEELTSLRNGFSANYEMNGEKYTLSVEGGENSSTLILETENKKQILFSVDKMGDTTWNLVWVGDLDGDGKLDIYANLPTYYNFQERRLFLSSEAKKGKLVQQVANFWTNGC